MKKRPQQCYEAGTHGSSVEPQSSTAHKKAKLSYLAPADEANFAKTIEAARQHLYRNALRRGSATPELLSTASTPESTTAATPAYEHISPVCIEAAPIQETIVGWTCSKVISQVLAVTEKERCMLSDLVHQPGDFSFIQGTGQTNNLTHRTTLNNVTPDDLEMKASSPHFPGFVISAHGLEDSGDEKEEEHLNGTRKPCSPGMSLTTGCIEDMLIREEQMVRKWLNLDGKSSESVAQATIKTPVLSADQHQIVPG